MATYSGGAVVDVLKYVIGIDTSQMKKGSQEAEQRISKMAGVIKRSMLMVGTAVAGAFGVYQLTKFIKSTTLLAARNEELNIVVRTLGKSSGYTNAYLREQEETIKALGITSQASKNLLIRFMQAQLDVSWAANIARAAQDLAVIGERDSSEAAEELTYALVAQRPILLKKYGIMVNLIKLYAQLAKEHNTTVELLTEEQKRMGFYNAIMEQANRVSGAYTAAMKTAGKQMRSLQRYVIELSNAVGKYFLPAFSAGVKLMTKFLKGARELFVSQAQLRKETYTKMEARFGEGGEAIQKMADRYVELRSKTKLTADEQEELNGLMRSLAGLLPGVNREYDEYGRIISLNVESLREQIQLQRDILKITEDTVYKDLKKDVKKYSEALTGLMETETDYIQNEFGWKEKIRKQGKEIMVQRDGEMVSLGKVTAGIKTYSERLKETRDAIAEYSAKLLEAQEALAIFEGKESKRPKAERDVQAQITDAAIEGVLKRLDLMEKYGKISSTVHLMALQQMVQNEKLSAEQRVKLLEMILEKELEVEKEIAGIVKREIETRLAGHEQEIDMRRDRLALLRQYGITSLQIQISYLQKLLKQEELTAKKRIEIEEEVFRLKLELRGEAAKKSKVELTALQEVWQEWGDALEFVFTETLGRIDEKLRRFASSAVAIFRGIIQGGLVIHGLIKKTMNYLFRGGPGIGLADIANLAGIVGAVAGGIFTVFDLLAGSTKRAAKETNRFAETIKKAQEEVEEMYLGKKERAIPLLESLIAEIRKGEWWSDFTPWLKDLKDLGIDLVAMFPGGWNIEDVKSILEDLRGTVENFSKIVADKTLPEMEDSLRRQVDLTFGEGEKLIDYWASKHNLTLEEQLELFKVLENILTETGMWTQDTAMSLENAIRELNDQIAEDIRERRQAFDSFVQGIDRFTRAQKEALMDTLNKVIGQIKPVFADPLIKAMGDLLNSITGKTKNTLFGVAANLGRIYKSMVDVFTMKDWRPQMIHGLIEKIMNYLFRGGPGIGLADIANLGTVLKASIGELTDDMKAMIKGMLEAAGLPVSFDLNNLLKMLGILEDDISDFEKLMSADTMKEFFQMLEHEAAISLNRGRELIDYWVQMYDLAAEDQLKLYKKLKDLLIVSGGWSEADLMSLDLILKKLEGEVTGAGGMTQVYRSVTAITERQGNLMVGHLNTLNNYVRQILDQIRGVVNGNGIPPFLEPRPVVQIGPIYTNDAKSLLDELEVELRGRGYSV